MTTTTDAPTVNETAPPMIYAAMAAVMSDVGAVGKTGVNKEQHYKFRSIEDVMSAVRAGLTRHGVFYLPTVISRVPETRQTGNGKPMNVVHLEIRYDFYAADGSSVSSVVWGEGADMADKATNKAMSQALKYNLVQAFSIASEDMTDADRETVEAGPDRSYRSAAEAFENASPRPAANGNGQRPAAASEDNDWHTPADQFAEYMAAAVSFGTEDQGRELWRAVAASAKARDITRDDAKQLQDIIQARIADLRASTEKPVEGVIVPGLDPDDEWAVKVADIISHDDAVAAAANVRRGMKSGHIAGDRGERILAAIDVRTASLAGTGAAA